jgi:uroporphyrinogen-III synthase
MAIFISPNAVHYGIAAIRAALSPSPSPASGRGVRGSAGEGRSALPPTLRIATVGQGSAKALRESGISNIIVPTERFDSEGLLALPELHNVSGWRVMIFRGDGGRELLGNTLTERGATVEYVSCYQRSKPQLDTSALLAARPDAVTVTSSEALGYLWQMLNDKERSALRNTDLFVPHARIAGLAREQGWTQVHVTSSGDDGMFSALITWAGQRIKGKAGLN